jgi:hypothetical protein
MTGRAIDLYLGDRNASERVAHLRTLPAYRWLVRNAGRFGFYPYSREPWHWEYNPPQAAAFEFGGADPASLESATAAHALAAAPTISPLADASHGLHSARRRTQPVAGVCVHTTGGGIATLATRSGRPAALVAVDFYLHGTEFPHYLVGYDGRIFAICDEQSVAPHAGWAAIGGRRPWATWTAPTWWSSVWRGHRARTPVDLLPRGARSPNDVYIGVELLANPPGLTRGRFTDAQYVALARLVRDITDRWHVVVSRVPSRQVLGHEDVNPISRQDRAGGWDPGAHRARPRFSWPKLWMAMTAASVIATARPFVQPVASAVASGLAPFFPQPASHELEESRRGSGGW